MADALKFDLKVLLLRYLVHGYKEPWRMQQIDQSKMITAAAVDLSLSAGFNM